jgi:integrase
LTRSDGAGAGRVFSVRPRSGIGCANYSPAGIEGLTFHDLRGTAVTRLAIAGATEAEIAAVTGHSLRDVHRILDRHYLARDPRLAESAIRKLERDGSGTDPTN